MSKIAQILIGEAWVDSQGTETFQAENPETGERIGDLFPISSWNEVESAIRNAATAAQRMYHWSGSRFADFLESFAKKLTEPDLVHALIAMANVETALPKEPRLGNELLRTIDQLRQAALAARAGHWAVPTIDASHNIRSILAPIGPVVVFGPNNFPFAFNAASGGDFAAAIAAGNPVIAIAHPCHPGTTRMLFETAFATARDCDMPAGFIQLIYHMCEADGFDLVSHDLIGATAFTGSQTAGLLLKEAADCEGKVFYLETGGINPVVILPGALSGRFNKVIMDFVESCLMGTGQFCTNPGLVLMLAGSDTEQWIRDVTECFRKAPVGTLLSAEVLTELLSEVQLLQNGGATILTGGEIVAGPGFHFQNTLLRVDGEMFVQISGFQNECFGNAALIVVARDEDQLLKIIDAIGGDLTASIYSAMSGEDDALYNRIEPGLRRRVGRLLNDKMPTGVVVSPAMCHGGPFPVSGHPGFTSVGMPASIRRFAALQCYDSVRQKRLPEALRDT